VVSGVLLLGLLSSTVATAAPAPRRQARHAAPIRCEVRGTPCAGMTRLGYPKTLGYSKTLAGDDRDGKRQSSCFKQIRRLLHRPSGTWLERSRTSPLGGNDLVALQNGAAVGGADDPLLLSSLEPLGLIAQPGRGMASTGSVTPRSPRGPPVPA
jgi:hypothetical protein